MLVMNETIQTLTGKNHVIICYHKIVYQLLKSKYTEIWTLYIKVCMQNPCSAQYCRLRTTKNVWSCLTTFFSQSLENPRKSRQPASASQPPHPFRKNLCNAQFAVIVAWMKSPSRKNRFVLCRLGADVRVNEFILRQKSPMLRTSKMQTESASWKVRKRRSTFGIPDQRHGPPSLKGIHRTLHLPEDSREPLRC